VLPRALTALAFLTLIACQNIPQAVAPPEQRQPMASTRPYRISHVLDLADGDTSRVVSDILGPAGGFSWTAKRPTIKIRLRGLPHVRYTIDFGIIDATFKDTGPVSITFLVNEHALETVRYTQTGSQHFEKDVPLEWIRRDEDTLISAEIDKVWIAPDDGAKLGFILSRMGLTEE